MTIEFRHSMISQKMNIDEIMRIIFKTETQAKVGALILKESSRREFTVRKGLYNSEFTKKI